MDKLYADYFQKSKVFLYPVLGIAKKSSIQVKDTFISWENVYTEEDKKFIVLYENVKTEAFNAFMHKVLLSSPLYESHKFTQDDQGIFVFDYSIIEEDWQHFLQGKYSKLSKIMKDSIMKYYGHKSGDGQYVKSYLYPQDFFHIYADLLNVKESLLKEVGELCDKYNPELEKLKISVELLECTAEFL